jgi:hypothetical protein
MEQSKVCGAILARSGPRQQRVSWQSLHGRPVRRLRGSGFGLGLVGVLVAVGGVAQPLPAQNEPVSQRLTVRPREMATGTRTERVGEQWLNSASGRAPIYVPQQCVGTRRCPLVVFIWGWKETMTWVRPMADKYGMILLSSNGNPQDLDAALKQVLQQFAIDPDKIAIMGTCATGQDPVTIGGDNFYVFSRIISLSGAPTSEQVEQVDPPTPTTEFFFDAGVIESERYFQITQAMRQKGYRVTQAFGFRQHGHTLESYDHVGQWLQETWALPDPATRPAPSVIADPLPELTIDVLTKMTAFWTRFVQEPESIRTTGRRAHLRAVSVPVGKERPMVMMTDMAALAAKYPSVAADLKAVGLTAQQHDAYRVALASAQVIGNSVGMIGNGIAIEDLIGPLDSASVMAKNVAFMKAHPDEFRTLEDVHNGYARDDNQLQVIANMWNMP